MSGPAPDDPIPRHIGNYYLQHCLGSGFSGSIHRAQHIHTGHVVALKLQHVDHECPTNRYERAFYSCIQGGVGMPTLWATGVEGVWDYLALELLGPSLDSLYRHSGKETMDLRSVCCIAMQLIARLEFMHHRGILHRDIQLGNCAIGLPPNQGTIYMIDFGFSKQYIDPFTRRHIQDSNVKRDFIGNYWFSSVAVHCKGRGKLLFPSRRDDLEAVALMLIHLLTPRGLSWTRNGVPKTDSAHERLKREKRHARPEDLCAGLPSEFEEFLRYCRRLAFQECPDYGMWVETFRDLAVENGFGESDTFIWPPPPEDIRKASATFEQYLPTRPLILAPPPGELDGILQGLRDLDLADTQAVIGDLAQVRDAGVLRARGDPANRASNSNNMNGYAWPINNTKAYKLKQLTQQVSLAVDNAALGEAVSGFVVALRSNTSKTMTRDAFLFIDALYKQLADPSVFLIPSRQSRSRSDTSKAVDPREKQDVMVRLCRDVRAAKGNRALGDLVREFGDTIGKDARHWVTKEGFAFLALLAERLQNPC
ncbi:CK1/CK1 protein kinase [Fistulina hepatica ATCC 64428]|uniref:CK1/CK1 protein kinase n=1 Tax=Fistulina hepatica ATCC 64428 TaxID=1128425 RepID=A0A0D7A720_9AGAR|nr:CK1/CK1 protein kinase [Fistulina hepatica ATCC 64428]